MTQTGSDVGHDKPVLTMPRGARYEFTGEVRRPREDELYLTPSGNIEAAICATDDRGRRPILKLLPATPTDHQGEAVELDRPTGTIFELDLFREKLQRLGDQHVSDATVWRDTASGGETRRRGDELRQLATELKTLIDNCQAQYVDRHPAPEPLEDSTPTKGPIR